MIRTIERRGDFAARAAPSKVDRDIASYISQAARAYLALVRHDTTEALQRLQALPDTHCPLCYQPRLTLGHLLSARLDDRTAAAQPDAPGGVQEPSRSGRPGRGGGVIQSARQSARPPV